MTLRTHVAWGRPPEAFQDRDLSVLRSRDSKEDGEGILKTLRARICDEIDSRWCVRPALESKREEEKKGNKSSHFVGRCAIM